MIGNDRAVYSVANSLEVPIADKSVHMICCSPPYWGLRDYGVDGQLGNEKIHDCLSWARGDEPCGACYVCNMRTWAREMWRVLRDDGVMFLNLGDSYYNYRPGGTAQSKQTLAKHTGAVVDSSYKRGTVIPGVKEKDLIGIPWRVALALQADGWYLRSDIIWAKPNPMPESVTDRPTKAHEYVFLLTKSARYFWDAEAVKETGGDGSDRWGGKTMELDTPKAFGGDGTVGQKPNRPGRTFEYNGTRNIRTVWTIATAPYSGAHYATWPPALVGRMVKAGSSERGVCPECGKPWERVVERTPMEVNPGPSRAALNGQGLRTQTNGTMVRPPTSKTTGWQPTCAHNATPIPATVLDPFAGSGTTLLVARKLGRIGLGFDLSETYLRDNAAVRLGHDKLAAWGNGIKDTTDYDGLFGAGYD